MDRARNVCGLFSGTMFSIAGYLISTNEFKQSSVYFLIAGILFSVTTLILFFIGKRQNHELNQHAGLGQASLTRWNWADYKQDIFDGLTWRWEYKLDLDDNPRDITPYCPQCDNRLKDDQSYLSQFRYRTCPNGHSYWMTDENEASAIRKKITKKITNGTWKQAVERRRLFSKS